MSQELNNVEESVSLSELGQLSLFKGVALESITGLINGCPVEELQRGQILISPGQKDSQNMYVLISGRLRVHLESIHTKVLNYILPGETVGEFSIIDGGPTSAYVIADEDCRLISINEEIFWALVHASHGVARNLLFMLTRRMRAGNVAVNESNRQRQEYQHQVSVDDLTGLHNRRWLKDALKRQIGRYSMNGEPLSLMMIDVDHFKEFNEEFGMLVGDQVLQAIAQVMMNTVRPTDLLARYDGEKFCVILPDSDVQGALAVANRVRLAVSEAIINLADGCILPSVTISVGVSQMQAFQSVELLLADANEALLRAKNNGRHCVSR